MSGPLLIVRTGATMPDIAARHGDFPDWIRRGMGAAEVDTSCVSVFEGEALPAPDEFAAVVVTGSSAMVTDRAEWSERTARWLCDVVARRVPLLGICYGHQLLAQAFGGEVGANPRGREMGTIEVVRVRDAAGSPLDAVPERASFQATHRESVLRLPDGAVRLASNALDPNQAFAFGDRAWGVQFHPEFRADVMRRYLDARRETLAEEGLDADALARTTRETPDGPLLLRRFAALSGLVPAAPDRS